MLDKLKEIINHIPIINLIPVVDKFITDFPKRWDNLPDEKKQQLFEALIAAGTKAAASYASGGGSIKL